MGPYMRRTVPTSWATENRQLVSGANLGTAVLKLTTDAGQVDKGFDRVERTALKRTRDIGRKMTLAITGPIIGIGTAIFGATNTVQEALKIIRVGTGATGEALQGLQDDFDAVWGSVPGGAQDAATAIAELNTRLKLTGEPLRVASQRALQFASIFDQDVAIVIENAAASMSIFGEGAESLESFLDRLTVTSQRTGIGVDELNASLQTYGPVLRNAGFETNEAIAIFGNLHAAGVDASRVFPGINSFLRNAAKEGVTDLKGALFGTIEQIKNATTETQQLNIATEAFGAEGAQRLLTAVQDGAFDIRALEQAMQGAGETVNKLEGETRTLSETIGLFRERATEVLGLFKKLPAPVQIAAVGFGGLLAVTGPLLFLLPNMVAGYKLLAGALSRQNIQLAVSKVATIGSTIATIARTAVSIAATAATWLLTAATTAFGVALRIATGPIGLIILGIAGLIAVGVLLWKNWDRVKAFFLGLWDRITGIFQGKIGLILAAIFPFIGIPLLIISNWGKIRNAITGILGGITSTVINWVATVKEVLLNAFGVRFFAQVFANVFSTFDRLRENITGVFRIPFELGWNLIQLDWEGIVDTVVGWWNEQKGTILAAVALAILGIIAIPFVLGWTLTQLDWEGIVDTVVGWWNTQKGTILAAVAVTVLGSIAIPFLLGWKLTQLDWGSITGVVTGWWKNQKGTILLGMAVAILGSIAIPFVLGWKLTQLDWGGIVGVVRGWWNDEKGTILKVVAVTVLGSIAIPFVLGWKLKLTQLDWGSIVGVVTDWWNDEKGTILKVVAVTVLGSIAIPFVLGWKLTQLDWGSIVGVVTDWWNDEKGTILKVVAVTVLGSIAIPFVLGWKLTQLDWGSIVGVVIDWWNDEKRIILAGVAFAILGSITIPFVLGWKLVQLDWGGIVGVVTDWWNDEKRIILAGVAATVLGSIAIPFVLGWKLTQLDWGSIVGVVRGWWNDEKGTILRAIGSLNPITIPFRLISRVIRSGSASGSGSAPRGGSSSGSGSAPRGGSSSGGRSAPSVTSTSPTNDRGLLPGEPGFFPGFQHGGIFSPRVGGTLARIAEGGESEVVSPLSKLPHLIGQINQNQGAMAGGGGRTIVVNLHIQGSVLAEEDIRDLARQGVLEGERRGQEDF